MDFNSLKIWIKENCHFSFARSGGPGGQHVNKTETKAVLKINIAELPFSEEDKDLIRFKLINKINSSGQLVIHSSEERSRSRNIETAIERAAILIKSSLKRNIKRYPTKPTRSSAEKRIKHKKNRAELKKMRNSVKPGSE